MSDDDDFLDRIGELAEKQRAGESFLPEKGKTDLSSFTPDDYPVVEITSQTDQKIRELNEIVRSIEHRTSENREIVLDQNYKINYRNELNPAQLAAVTSIKGPVLVIAGAGSGKTRVIVHRVAFMLENGIDPNEILLLTFTRKAASEMLGRVQSLLQNNTAQKIFGGTFHSFANYILRKYAGLLGIHPSFTIIDSEDAADTIDLVKSELKIEKKEKAFPKKHRLQEIFSSARNRNMTIREVIMNDFQGLIEYMDQIELISRGYERYKKAARIYDYDDLMDVLRDSLRDNLIFRRRLNEHFRYIMVDEYQDTNVVQKQIVEYLAETHRNILVVGDDAQSIYSFRGANYENILRFPQKYPDCGVIKIEENYRSNQKILDFTNEIILNSRIGYRKKLYSSMPYDQLPVVRKFYDQQSEAEFIVDRILEYRERGVAVNQIAILVRAFWHARYIEIELNRRSIPYIAVGGLAFNERKHVKDVISYLRIVQNHYDAVAWHRVLKYLPGVGLTTARKIIEGIVKQDGLNTESFEKARFSGALKRLVLMLNEAEAARSIQAKIEVIREYYFPILQAEEPDFQVRILDINVLADLASKYETLDKFLTDFALDPPSKKFGSKTVPLIDEGEDKPLTISTIHSAKGLEWYSVFIPHALDGLIPSVRSISNLEEIEEERRLFYVACSRAKQDLIITMPSYVATYNAFLSYPSRFLVEISREKFNYQ
ncbi:MAG TPA: ATP-dependent helicase [Bacteroidales bacterium]|nr:ATP-dependent helicase [Bacteroidales bacterium]